MKSFLDQFLDLANEGRGLEGIPYGNATVHSWARIPIPSPDHSAIITIEKYGATEYNSLFFVCENAVSVFPDVVGSTFGIPLSRIKNGIVLRFAKVRPNAVLIIRGAKYDGSSYRSQNSAWDGVIVNRLSEQRFEIKISDGTSKPSFDKLVVHLAFRRESNLTNAPHGD